MKNTLFTRLITLILAFLLTVTAIPFHASAAENGCEFANLDTEEYCYQANQVLTKEKDFTLTTDKLSVSSHGYILLELTLKNTGREALRFKSSCSYIQGYCVDSFLYETVRPGKQSTVRLSIDILPLSVVDVRLLQQMDLVFDVYDEETGKALYQDCSATIPLGIPIYMDFHPYYTCLYEGDGFRLSVLGSAKVADYAPRLVYLLENDLNGPLMARNDNDLIVNNTEYDLYVHETAAAYSRCVFSLSPYENFFENYPANVACMEFPLQICTGNLNPMIDTKSLVRINTEGKILDYTVAAAKNSFYDNSMREYSRNSSLFQGMFQNYEPNEQYIAALKRKFPEGTPRYANGKILLNVSELLTLYLANLEENGYRYGVIERADMCRESSYVVELTQDGQSVIQVAFTIDPYDPKCPQIMTVGFSTGNYKDLDAVNDYMAAMWIAYDTLNVPAEGKIQPDVLSNSEVLQGSAYGTLLRGQYDGLGYLYAIGDEQYLSITPDLSLSIFEGMQVKTGPASGLRVGDTFTFGSYEQDNNTYNGAEPIEWFIVDSRPGAVLAVSVNALDSRRYHQRKATVTWRNCDLRTWLNKDFLKAAFDESERALLCPTEVENTCGEDSVFLLSREEVLKYFPDEDDRICEPTAYAIAHGGYRNYKTGGGWWLLRTRCWEDGFVMSVNSDGVMDTDGAEVNCDKGTVRPAIWISTGE